uniref:Gamma-butyrobetaine hydroxylase-like N-terminal domain-containing protein n=1 Tax=Entomoneis paludosa TaxID=265537 RepID=A0A7S2YAX9_9STRA
MRLFSSSGAVQKRIFPSELRSRDPKTGDIIEDSPFREQKPKDPFVRVHSSSDVESDSNNNSKKKPSPSVTPVQVDRKGRYGFAVQWADGATIIYSKVCLAKASGGLILDPPPSEE